jgi:hypothetical protein
LARRLRRLLSVKYRRAATMSESGAVGLTALAIVVALAGVYVRGLTAALTAGAWTLFVWGPALFVLFWCHVGIHAWIANRTQPPDRRTLFTIMASHAAFLTSFLLQYLQYDEGGRQGWLIDLAYFTPTVLSYALLWCFRPRAGFMGVIY